MQNFQSSDNSSADSVAYPSAGFAGDQSTAHAFRAANLISKYLELSSAARSALQEFVRKMLYYKRYNFDDLCIAVAIVYNASISGSFSDIVVEICRATGKGTQEFPQLLFLGAYALAAASRASIAVPEDDFISKLAADSRAYSVDEIFRMTEKLRHWSGFNCLDIVPAVLAEVKASLQSRV